MPPTAERAAAASLRITPEQRAELRQLARDGHLRPAIVALLDALDASELCCALLTEQLVMTQGQLVQTLEAANTQLQRMLDALAALAWGESS